MKSLCQSRSLKRALELAYGRHAIACIAKVSTAEARAVDYPAGNASDGQRLSFSGPGLDHFLRLHDAQHAQQPDSSPASQPLQASPALLRDLRRAPRSRATCKGALPMLVFSKHRSAHMDS